MEIRVAKLDDSEVITKFVTELGYPIEINALKSRLTLYEFKKFPVMVAVDKERLLGFIAVSIHELFVAPTKRAHIEAMFVDPKYRNKQIGKSLILAAEQFARGEGCQYIDLTSGEHRAQTGTPLFYNKMGFHNEGLTAKKYFRKYL